MYPAAPKDMKLRRTTVAAHSTVTEHLLSSGASQSPSKSSRSSSSSLSSGPSPNHPGGSSKLAVKKKPATSSAAFEERRAKTWAEPRQNSRIFATPLNSNVRLPPKLHTSRCSSALAPANFTLVVVSSLSSGSRLCRNGSVSLV